MPWPGRWHPFGATAADDGINVALWAPDATGVTVCLFDEDGGERRIDLTDATFHVWHGFIPGCGPGQRYGFRVDGPWEPQRGHRFDASKLLIDPYARAIEGSLTYHDAVFERGRDSAPFVPRSVVVGADDFDWQGVERPRTQWADSVLYELHVRGFTLRHPSVPPDIRGTFAGLAHPAVIEHLVSLGVTAVELMPVHHFVSEPELVARGLVNYWGYNSLGYFAPHAPYSSSGTRGQQVSDFKSMVRALHAAGIEVILDVVYNHTAEQSVRGATLSLRGIDDRRYYRQMDDGTYVDFTGCGNTLDLRQPRVLGLVMDSLRYWVTEMGVDGFRFDLATALARSLHDVDRLSGFLTVIEQDPVLSQVKLIAEPWDVGADGYAVGEFPVLWTEWNDRFRDTMRDFWRGSGSLRDLGYRLSGSSDLYGDDGRRPYASVNFVTAHDGFTLLDLVSYERKHNVANGDANRDGSDNNRSWNCGVEGPTTDENILALRRRQIRNLMATLVLATGVPMVVAGDEMGRTQGGNNNAYCQDNEVSWVNWDLAAWQRDFLSFTRALVAIRREHPVFRQRHFFDGRPMREGGPQDLSWFTPNGHEFDLAAWNDSDLRTIGVCLAGDAIDTRGRRGQLITDSTMLLLLHAGDAAQEFVLPGEPWSRDGWRLRLDTSARPAVPENPEELGGAVTLEPRSVVLLESGAPG
ncbi:MAG: glycogen debranching protein GlgX [Candidatus Nanopelagicales bacterium]